MDGTRLRCPIGSGRGRFRLHAQLIDRFAETFTVTSVSKTTAPTRFVVQSIIETRRFVGEILFDQIKPPNDTAAKKHGTVTNNFFELTESAFESAQERCRS